MTVVDVTADLPEPEKPDSWVEVGQTEGGVTLASPVDAPPVLHQVHHVVVADERQHGVPPVEPAAGTVSAPSSAERQSEFSHHSRAGSPACGDARLGEVHTSDSTQVNCPECMKTNFYKGSTAGYLAGSSYPRRFGS